MKQIFSILKSGYFAMSLILVGIVVIFIMARLGAVLAAIGMVLLSMRFAAIGGGAVGKSYRDLSCKETEVLSDEAIKWAEKYGRYLVFGLVFALLALFTFFAVSLLAIFNVEVDSEVPSMFNDLIKFAGSFGTISIGLAMLIDCRLCFHERQFDKCVANFLGAIVFMIVAVLVFIYYGNDITVQEWQNIVFIVVGFLVFTIDVINDARKIARSRRKQC